MFEVAEDIELKRVINIQDTEAYAPPLEKKSAR